MLRNSSKFCVRGSVGKEQGASEMMVIFLLPKSTRSEMHINKARDAEKRNHNVDGSLIFP